MSRRREVIKIKKDDETDYLYLEGNVLDHSENIMLMELTNLRQKDIYDNYSLSEEYTSREQTKPYAVVRFDENGDDASFFDDPEQAHIFFDKQKNK